MLTLNTKEEIPEFFYIFTDRNADKLANKIEKHNIGLRNGTLVSSGFSNLFRSDSRESFLTGEIDYLPFIPNTPTTIGPISPFLSRITERYTLEYNLEIYRRIYHKTYPSRFSGLFAFGNMEDCENLANGKLWELTTVKRYKLMDLTEIGLNNKYYKIIKANFKIIGAMEHYGTTYASPQVHDAIKNYWNGTGEYVIPEYRIDDDIIIDEKKCGVRWEYLIEGILEEA